MLKALEERKPLLISGGVVLGGAVVIGFLYDWYISRDGSSQLSVDQKAVYAECDGQSSRVSPKSISSASSTLASSFTYNPMIKELSNSKLSPEGLFVASTRLCKVLLRTVLPSSQGSVVLGTPDEGAIAVWLPHGTCWCSRSFCFLLQNHSSSNPFPVSFFFLSLPPKTLPHRREVECTLFALEWGH